MVRVSRITAPQSAPPAAEPADTPAATPRWAAYLAVPAVIAASYFGAANLFGWERPGDVAPVAGTAARSLFDEVALAEAATVVVSAATGGAALDAVESARLGEDNQSVYVALRAGGARLGAAWRDGGTVAVALDAATVAARASIKGERVPDTAEVCVAHSFREVAGRRRRMLSNIYRGVRGIELELASGTYKMSPTTMLAMNLDFAKAIDRIGRRDKVTSKTIDADDIRTFDCDQFVVDLGAGTARPMTRGNTVVALAAVDRSATQALHDGMARWLFEHLRPDGRMTYKWWPSQGREASSNNMIRQWMATVASVRHAVAVGDPELVARTASNIDYNLDQFYKTDDAGRGFIEYNRKAKLGAAALAAMAIALHPQRSRWRTQENALLATIFHLQRDDGMFSTFLLPPSRVDNQNFYPGEALYYLATRYRLDGDDELRERIMRGFNFYRGWYARTSSIPGSSEQPRPAFVPWHTQAYYLLWQKTRDPELARFIFTINDWLLTMQQWDTAAFADTRGRFYDPKRRRYGPPHASSTGVYLEGLIDAFALARELGDRSREAAYLHAIVGGIRSLIQLQFADEIDMFYIHERDRARGGIRTTVYDNVIRVDNVQHGFMGLQKILDRLAPEDYARGRAGR